MTEGPVKPCGLNDLPLQLTAIWISDPNVKDKFPWCDAVSDLCLLQKDMATSMASDADSMLQRHAEQSIRGKWVEHIFSLKQLARSNPRNLPG